MGLFNRIKEFIKNAWAVDDNRWYSRSIAPETASGAKVDESTAFSIPAVWACIRIISEDIGSLPLHLYTRMRNGKERAVNHPMYYLLHDRPNPEMSAMSFRETLASHILSWGNAYAEKELDEVNQVKALWPLPPDQVNMYRDRATGQIYYKVQVEETGESKILLREQMLHIPGLSFNGLVGLSPIGRNREAIGFAAALEEFGARFFGAGTHPGAVVSHPGKLGLQAHENLKKSLSDGYSGLGKTHRMMLLEEGMKFETIGIPPEDAQFLETRRFQLAEIARIYKMPLHKLQEYEKGMAFASVEQFSLDYVGHTLRPWLVRFEQAYNWQLFSNNLQRRRYFYEHLVDGLLRGDIKSRYEAYAVGRNWGWLSADDIRELENINPLPDGKGKIYLQPLNMIEAGTPPPEPPAPEPPQSDMAYWKNLGFKHLFQDAIEQILSREANGLKRLAAKANGEWPQILDEYYDLELQGFMERKITPAIRNFIYQNCGSKPDDRLIENEARSFVQEHIRESKEILNKTENRGATLSEFSNRAGVLAGRVMERIHKEINHANANA